MGYIDTNRKTTTPTTAEKGQPLGRIPLLNGVYMGFIKDASDVQYNGRLRVWIPELGSAPDNEQGWATVSYCSPFAGATNVETISKTNLSQFEGTQTSYGLWMIPPDINNQVIVMFINGDMAKGIWIGCLYNQFMNNMVPAMASDSNNYQYQDKTIPVAEYNKWDTKVTDPDATTKPYNATKFKGIGNQGLINDEARGVTDTSARRESPSAVFGISTPGPAIDDNSSPENIRRMGGSYFVMDDGDGSEYIQLETKTGAQIKLDETNGFVYVINRDGTSWIQMDQKGNIDIFGATNISMRAQQDINIRGDRNVNIEAGQNVFIKAAKDTNTTTTSFTFDVNNENSTKNIPYYQYVGEGSGTGGNIVFQAQNNVHTTVKNNAFITVGQNLELSVSNSFDVAANSQYNLTSPNIKHVGAVGIRGTLSVTGSAGFGASLGVAGSISGATGSFAGSVNGFFEGVLNGPGAGITGSAGGPVSVSDAPSVTPAEVKQLTQKINILTDWKDPSSKFTRNAQSLLTTLSTLPTYEPCPEHETFKFGSIDGYTPKQTPYNGSGGAGNDGATTPPTNTDPGANNKDLPPTPAADSAVTKNFNLAAYECQLKKHEGVKYNSYLDSRGLPTAGIGHLLRSNEISQYPVPTPVSSSQVDAWFQQDATTSIAGAQALLGNDTWDNLSDVRKRACADLCYNLGQARLSKFVGFLSAMKSGDYNTAGDSLRNSKWFTQVGRRGPEIITMIVQNVDPTGCDVANPPS